MSHDMGDLEQVNEYYMRKMELSSSVEQSRFLALALAGEVGELANLIKKEWRDGPSPERNKAIAEEMADCAIYLHHLALSRFVDLPAEIQLKAQKLRIRWPQAFGEKP
jgi:NTP pyrophosphatase (non-canonical NTP hydrolase)